MGFTSSNCRGGEGGRISLLSSFPTLYLVTGNRSPVVRHRGSVKHIVVIDGVKHIVVIDGPWPESQTADHKKCRIWIWNGRESMCDNPLTMCHVSSHTCMSLSVSKMT